jgi:hypothetical protein
MKDKPKIHVYNCLTGEETDREMTEEEFVSYQEQVVQNTNLAPDE